ncbi:DNA repair protein RadC [Chitinophaga jiangningensis]|uniref:DNA repair protein RadC n=1 Tax=Chitinophaga jiangningensis TaxID=1419482 RepID=A0A1M7FFY6_9BACT|nr:DNA repair protein RadC [Chitinophaga jiangningensis]SHM02885.1 DNA repair protein RadC [Chitinophaga jiangningensis]
MFVNVNPGSHVAIKDWPDADKPREKLIDKGVNALSDAELLAILLQTGYRQKSAVDLAREILRLAKDNLSELGRLNVRDLRKLRGMGTAKAVTVVAALELSRRRQSTSIHKKNVIHTSSDAALFFKPLLADQYHETFYVMFLNHAQKVLLTRCISSGGMSSTVVDPKLIFREALEVHATKIILCHNHPSGSLRPSESDINVTKKIRDAGKLFDIEVLDHIIVAETGYLSLVEEGVL